MQRKNKLFPRRCIYLNECHAVILELLTIGAVKFELMLKRVRRGFLCRLIYRLSIFLRQLREGLFGGPQLCNEPLVLSDGDVRGNLIVLGGGIRGVGILGAINKLGLER